MIDDLDDPPLSDFDEDLIEGAAEDSASGEQAAAELPRVLRYAVLASRADHSVYQRLAAEIETVCPGIALTATWIDTPDAASGCALAIELDHRAVREDQSECRSLADCVRLISLALPRDRTLGEEHRRVASALAAALRKLPQSITFALAAEVEAVVYGWAALPVCAHEVVGAFQTPAIRAAAMLGARMARRRIDEAEEKAFARSRERLRKADGREAARGDVDTAGPLPAVPDGHVVVARTDPVTMSGHKFKEIITPLKSLIDVPLPLIKTPPLAEVRRQLMAEFSYAASVVDFVLSDLVGRPTIAFRPLLMVGPPGGGKTRFAQRLHQLLGIGMWRTDSSGADGAAFSGTDRRWATAQPCHPLLAIARAGHANVLVLLDELDKAAISRDHGRLFDCLLGFLEIDSARQYPDPALQTTVDLRHVCYVATANFIDNLPSPLLDRFRQIVFPKPAEEDLQALLPAVVTDILRDQGMDQRWIDGLSPSETAAIAHHWRGGSVRRLRRLVEIVLRQRDGQASRH
ncbi:AAA family ATPase [Bradyrhizobium sp. C-145]|uniref:AAA family ATPase n=1 Tax=Bradyrhizobium sp. C-145 TaxID=574727 RepID=UPI00201B6023|nr:AAA family ATPase [Bradyrhizobium sp. C-145]UQR60779.1 AAA family ATPase [Bradyrhizobium sp. C-145]